jgi:MerR family Zn(II)-responsive transcriptional regulator of zntA
MRLSVTGTTFRIGELAARSGVTPDTLRYYERLGLLPRAHRSTGGFRLYTREAFDRLRFVKQAQSLGLTLHEIRDLLGYESSAGLKRCRQVRDMLRTKLLELQRKLEELEDFQRTLSGYLDRC